MEFGVFNETFDQFESAYNRLTWDNVTQNLLLISNSPYVVGSS